MRQTYVTIIAFVLALCNSTKADDVPAIPRNKISSKLVPKSPTKPVVKPRPIIPNALQNKGPYRPSMNSGNLTPPKYLMRPEHPKPPEPEKFKPRPEWSESMKLVATGNNVFACNLYSRMLAESGNVFFSPYSIHTALAMTALGARSTTAEQMTAVLHLPRDQEKQSAVGDVVRAYSSGDRPYQLEVANSLWAQKGISWNQNYLKIQNERFGAVLREADFAANPAVEIQRINGWVSEKTRGKITEMLSAQDVTQHTRNVLVNAIYFKGKWSDAFSKQYTKEAPFTLADGKQTRVNLMFNSGRYSYGETADFQIIKIPYQAHDLAMTIILPRTAAGLPAIEKNFSQKNLTDWKSKMLWREVHLSLPRFKVEYQFEPQKILRQMGIVDAFEPAKADFSGISSEPMYVAKVIHRAVVELNEEGTEAVAATAVSRNLISLVRPTPPEVFKADHPFLYLIHDLDYDTILFMGRLSNPEK